MIFISYSREDSDFVLKLAESLRNKQANVWLDQFNIDAGAQFDDIIENAIVNCTYFIVVVSTFSKASDNVKDELSFAKNLNKTIIPIQKEKVESWFRVDRLNHIDFTNDFDNGIKKLLNSLGIKSPSEVKHPGDKNEETNNKEGLENEKEELLIHGTSSIVGIDFGTTKSSISVIESGRPIIIPNVEGKLHTPSVVYFNDSGQVIVGRSAVNQSIMDPKNSVYSVKRHLGSDWEVQIRDATYSAKDIATFVLKDLKSSAENYLGKEIRDAVLTVPAYFNEKQNRDAKIAAINAGFNIVRSIAEPTSASLAYCQNTFNYKKIAVYDLGGGTFDISILELDDGIFEVKAVNGDPNLGGDDFDSLLVNYFKEDIYKEKSIQLDDPIQLERLRKEAEVAKISLSGADQVSILIPYLYHSAELGTFNFQTVLTRAKFQELTESLVNKTIECCKKALEDSSLKVDDIDELFLVGLSTKIPLVREKVSLFFEKKPKFSHDPDDVVAIGAALQGGVISGNVKNQLLLDVIPQNLGIETIGGVFTKILESNTTIPAIKSEEITTVEDNQSHITINVLQGFEPMAKDNIAIGTFQYKIEDYYPKGVPKFKITFDLDANAILTVKIKESRKSAVDEFKLDISFINELVDTTKEYLPKLYGDVSSGTPLPPPPSYDPTSPFRQPPSSFNKDFKTYYK